jgi:hypothetical protein
VEWDCTFRVHIPFYIDVAPSKGAKEYPDCEREKEEVGSVLWHFTLEVLRQSFAY